MDVRVLRALTSYEGRRRDAQEGVELDVQACIHQLNEFGFEPAYFSDLSVGDIWIKEPERFPYRPESTMLHVVERILPVDATYFDEDDKLVQNVVMNMVVYSEDGVRRHMTYGSTHGVYIFRGVV